jgi:hypothetical protein
MTELLLSAPAIHCQAVRRCDRAPCFQARLEAAAGRRPVRRHAEICAEHLGCTVQALAAWAREQSLEGKVTVLAIDQRAVGEASSPARPDDWVRGFAFGTILLGS